MPLLTRTVLTAFLTFALVLCVFAASEAPGQLDEQALKDAGVSTDSRTLLDFFRKRTLTADAQKKIETLIRQFRAARPGCRGLVPGRTGRQAGASAATAEGRRPDGSLACWPGARELQT